jgi:acyl carrier protein
MAQRVITDEQVLAAVAQAVAETRGCSAAAVRPESSMIKDLGAESLDFLDINYRLEQAFGIKMARHFILEHIEELFGEGTAIDQEGRLTGTAVRFLHARYGDGFPGFRPNMDVDEVPALLTVGTIAGAVRDILDTLPGACARCGQTAWKSAGGVKVACGSCGEPATYTNGDELLRQWLTKTQREQSIC